VALEVSSFQASDVEVSPEVGVLTALVPDHLDWHGSFAAYVDDKLNLFAHGCRAVVVDATVDDDIVGRLPGAVRSGTADGWHPDHEAGEVRLGRRPVLPLAASPLLGPHNARNLCAALATLDVLGLDPAGRADEVEAALRRFTPLPFRLELVGAFEGRQVVDDSISTNPSAAVAALASFPQQPVAVIAGGDDRRGLAYDGLAAALAVRPAWTLAVCTGPAGRRLAALLPADRHVVADGFDHAVLVAADRCPEGGVVLLSPGAPSFDEFDSYRERGARLRTLLGLPPPRSEL
jgi:UDP-N-acetylmuramoylalanine--D-glutamate ligase